MKAVFEPQLDPPSLQSMEGHLQTSMEVWVDNNKNNNSQGSDKLNIWKLANIVPIPKPNKDIERGTSYRPIILFSVIAKTLEKSLLPYITENIPTQHGYKTLYSDGSTHIKQHCSKGAQPNGSPARTITVALNMSKTFDTINIYTLIKKLLQTKIPGTIIKFIANYIKGQTI